MNQHTHCECGHILQDHAEGQCHGCIACLDDPQHFATGKYVQCNCPKFKEAKAA